MFFDCMMELTNTIVFYVFDLITIFNFVFLSRIIILIKFDQSSFDPICNICLLSVQINYGL